MQAKCKTRSMGLIRSAVVGTANNTGFHQVHDAYSLSSVMSSMHKRAGKFKPAGGLILYNPYDATGSSILIVTYCDLLLLPLSNSLLCTYDCLLTSAASDVADIRFHTLSVASSHNAATAHPARFWL